MIARDGERWHVLEERLEQAEGPRHPAQRAAGAPRRAVDRRATGAAAGIGDRSRVLGRRRRVARRRRRPTLTEPEVPTGEALDRLRAREVVYQREKSAFDAHPRVPVQARPAARRRLRGDAAPAPARSTTAGGPVVRADGRMPRVGPTSTPGSSPTTTPAAATARRRPAGTSSPASRPLPSTGSRRPPAARPGHRARRPSRRRCSASTSCSPASRCSTGSAIGPPSRPIWPSSTRSRRPLAEIDPARRIRLLLTRCRWTFHHSEYERPGGGRERRSNSPSRPAATTWSPRPACGWARD